MSVGKSTSVPLSSLSPPVSEAAYSPLSSVDSSPSSVVQAKKRAKTYMTKNKKYVKKVEEKNAKTSKFKRVLKDLQRGKYNSVENLQLSTRSHTLPSTDCTLQGLGSKVLGNSLKFSL